MPIAMEETYLSRSGDKTSRKVKFVVTGSDDDAAVRAHAEANIPSTHDGLVFQKISGITQIADERWEVTGAYGQLTGRAAVVPEPEGGTASYSFSAQVEPKIEYFSRDRQKILPAGVHDLVNGPIGLQLADGRGRHAGIEVPAGPITDEITYEYPAAVIPSNYRSTVRGLIGGANNAAWLGEPAGTMRLVSVRAQITSESKQTISFGWAFRPKLDIKVGAVDLGPVDGWDFVWSLDETQILPGPDGEEIPIIVPYAGFVERLVPRVNFGLLALPSF